MMNECVEIVFRFHSELQEMRFSEIPSTARVRLEIAQRRVCTSSLSSGQLRIKMEKTQLTLDINVDTD